MKSPDPCVNYVFVVYVKIQKLNLNANLSPNITLFASRDVHLTLRETLDLDNLTSMTILCSKSGLSVRPPEGPLGLLVLRVLRQQHSDRPEMWMYLGFNPRAPVCAGGALHVPEPGVQSTKIANSYSSYSSLQKAKPVGPMNTVCPRTVT